MTIVTRRVLALFAFTGLMAVNTARAEEFDVDGHRLRIETFAGYCLVDRNDPVGHVLYDMTFEGSDGTEAILSIQAGCAALDRFWKQRSQPVRLEPALAVRCHLTDGKAVPLALTRDKFLAMKETALEQETGDAASSSARQGEEAAVARLKAMVPDIMVDTAVGGTVALGVLDRDEVGIYYGIVQVFDNAGKRYVQAALAASTLIDNLPVTIVRTDQLSDPDRLPAMTAEIKRLLHELVKLNEGAT